MNLLLFRIPRVVPLVLAAALCAVPTVPTFAQTAAKNPSALAQAQQKPGALFHVWSDGKTSVEAEFLALEGDSVQVRTRTGQTHRLNLTKLQASDRVFAQKAALIQSNAGAAAGGAGTLASTTPVAVAKPGASPVIQAVAGVANIVPEGEVSFRRDVMPVFFRASCNSGGCHGAASGKDGFRLSLFGYDPAGDYFRLTQEMFGRRVDLSEPAESLLLLKATGKVAHTGGTLFDARSPYYQVLLKWIQQGAQNDAESVAETTGIRIEPSKLLFQGPQKRQALRVLASFSDGTERDITSLALFVTNNKTTADLNENGVVTSGRPGATDVFARYNRFTVGAEVIVLPSDRTFQWPAEAKPVNFIDEAVFKRLKNLEILPSGLCTDEEFQRRVTFDVTGLPPTEEEIRTFTSSAKPDKRERLVDILLARPEYADVWAAHWKDWLRIHTGGHTHYGTNLKSAHAYSYWLTEQFRNNVPLDQFVRAQVGSRGATFSQLPVNFYNMLVAGEINPSSLAQDVAQICLGIRIQCAECHNHPFDRWTQDDYYGFVSFFSGIKRKQNIDPTEVTLFYDARAPLAKHRLDQRPMAAKFLGAETPEVAGKDPRGALAEWMTAPQNAMFSRNMANRIWWQFFGTGIVEPIDDLRVTNPPSNPELLEALSAKLVAYGFDQKRLIRDILTSRTYQLSSRVNKTNRDDSRQFSNAPVRRLPAVVAMDAVAAITEVETRTRNSRPGDRLIQAYDNFPSLGFYFVECFGQSDHESSDVAKDRREVTLSQTLHLINGDTLQERIQRSRVVQGLIAAKKTPEQIVESLYLRTLGRKPDANEWAVFQRIAGGTPTRATYDQLWKALFNSTEFLFQH